METAQKFTLGSLVSASTTTYPSEVNIRIQGRGTFCRLVAEYSFSNDNPSVARLFTIDRPWNAVLVNVALNGEPAQRQESPGERKSLPAALKIGVQEVFQDGSPDIVSCFIEPGFSLRTVTLEFMMSCDVLWHKSYLTFTNLSSRVQVNFDINWDLGGLPGAQLECTDSAADSRFSSLDDTRQQWNETISLLQHGTVGIKLALDEKKAASICLFSKKEADQFGCGAVVVVAPVRPQLLRKPVRVAVVVEVRNPQEGLATRDLVDQLSSALNPTDQISITLMGTSVTHKLLNWKQAADVQEDDLAQLLDPSMMGRAQYFWEGFQRVLEDCQDATHVLLSSPGPAEPSPNDLVCRLPVFTLAMGRKPKASNLEDLASKTGGFLSEQGIDGVDSFLQRLIIRLSPPLLRDFRLEGWGLEKVYPPGVTQVYTDKPTLVLGLYDGLLPQTVTLGGLSPAGQKLAQRVRVENFSDFSLMPLFEERSKPRGNDSNSVKAIWSSDKLHLIEATRPVDLEEVFELQEPATHDVLEGMGQPAIDMVSPSSVEMDTPAPPDLAGPPGSDTYSGDLFSPGADGGSTMGSDLFAGADEAPKFVDDGESLFSEEPLFSDEVKIEDTDFFDEVPDSADSDSESLADPFDQFPGSAGDTIVDSLDFGEPSGLVRPKDQSSKEPISSSGDSFEFTPVDEDLFAPEQRTEKLGFDGPTSEQAYPFDDDAGSDTGATISRSPTAVPSDHSDHTISRAPTNSGFEDDRTVAHGPVAEPTTADGATLSRHPNDVEGIQEPNDAYPSSDDEPPVSRESRSTVSVDFKIPDWVQHLSQLETEEIRDWLVSCPIDHLALALVDTDMSLADTFLSKLEGPRKTAVELQMEWGKLLPPEERQAASQAILERLRNAVPN
jgi:hypothetical protein